MTVYIEYAFLQNFLLDGVLLWLALSAARLPVRKGRLVLSATVGGVFAVVFPLLSLPRALKLLLKFAVGLLLCGLTLQSLRGKREWRKYALSASCFFLFTFCFGGAMLSVTSSLGLQRLSAKWVGIAFALLTAGAVALIKTLYVRREKVACLYECTLFFQEKKVTASGFLDSGNLVTKNGLPVCFLSVDLLYDLCGEEMLKDGGQVCDEIQITTVAGEKKLPVYLGEIQIKSGREISRKQVYFARATNMISREYKVLLHSGFNLFRRG